MQERLESLLDEIVLWLPKLLVASLIMLLFVFMTGLLVSLCRRFLSSRANGDVIEVLVNAIRITVLLFGAVTALGTLGIDVSALVAGLGLTGFALGFALKDVVSNLLAGVMVLMYQPFRRGDTIEIGAMKGMVQSIDLRYTRLRADDSKDILIPNATLMTSNIVLTRR